MRRIAVVAVVAILVLAGCTAPALEEGLDDSVGDGTGAVDSDPDPDSDPDIEASTLEVRGGTLPFEENRTLERVETLLAVEIRPPVVYVEEPLERPRGPRDPTSFEAVMGIDRPDPDDADGELRVGGVASPMQAVYVLPEDDASAAELERVFVHELVHVAQFQQDAPQRLRAAVPDAHRGTTDAELASLSVMEGAAVYGSAAYTERYDEPVEPEDEVVARLYDDAAPGTKLVWGPYHHGAAYVAERADEPADHWSLYDDPPVTMRGVLEGSPATDALEPFEATLSPADAGWVQTDSDVLGEYVLRQVLATELETDRSAEAARGWTYDRLLRVEHDDAALDGYAWTVRFEGADEADAFETAVRVTLAERHTSADGAGTDATWTDEPYAFALESVDERTVAILAGSEAFVESASVDADGPDVRVTLTETPAGPSTDRSETPTAGVAAG